MKLRLSATLFLLAALPPAAGSAQILSELSLPAGGNGRSQRAEVAQWIGPVKVSIDYHSPSLHTPAGEDRRGHVWGELVPYGLFDDGHGPSRATPWRAGANETTTITFSDPVEVGGHPVAAGTYGLFVVLAEKGPWTWILSTDASGWGSYQYDPGHDVLRVEATPLPAPPTEFLTYEFDARGESSAVAELRWDEKRLPLPIAVPDVNALYVARMRQELRAWPGFDYQNWQTAAQFCADAKINLEEALVWADKAISEPFRGGSFGRVDFSTLSTKAAVLEAMGRKGEASAVMDRAMALPGTDMLPLHVYGSRLLAGGDAKRALEVFLINQKRHPEERFWTQLGLARAYTALGDKPHAIASWKAVLANVPDGQKGNVARFGKALKALEAGS